ncbi:MAG: lipid II flippase MurJ [Thiotrichales bacterium]
MPRSVTLLVLAGGNVLAGLVAQLLIYGLIGPGATTDAFFAAVTVPQMLAGMVTVSLSSVLLPLFAGDTPEQQNASAWALIALLGAISTLVAASLSALAPWWIELVFPGFDTETRALCVELARIQAFSLIFLALAVVAHAAAYARDRFARVEAITLLNTALSAGLLALTLPRHGIVAAAWIELGRSALQLLWFLPLLGWPVRHAAGWQSLPLIWRRTRPMLLGNLYSRTDPLVDRFLLSMGSAGDLSLYGLAQQIYSAVANVFGRAFGTPAITALSIAAKQGDADAFRRTYRRALAYLLGLPLALYLPLLLFGEPVMQVALGVGRMDPAHVHTLWTLMVLLGGVLLLGASGALVAGLFYSIGDTRTPTYLGMLTFTVFIVARYFAFTAHGAAGVAVAASIYHAFNLCLLFMIFPRRLRAARVFT